ncbi:hypothetical protein [Helicobacter sp. TUL]|nr:hypothetical protein [Helicobacter sp. TUL]
MRSDILVMKGYMESVESKKQTFYIHILEESVSKKLYHHEILHLAL